MHPGVMDATCYDEKKVIINCLSCNEVITSYSACKKQAQPVKFQTLGHFDLVLHLFWILSLRALLKRLALASSSGFTFFWLFQSPVGLI